MSPIGPSRHVTIEFRRHSLKDGAHKGTVGPKGHALARAIGASQLRGRKFDAAFVSPLSRTHQTFWAFAEGAGDFTFTHAPTTAPIYVEYERMKPFYRICRAAEKQRADMLAAGLNADRALVTEMAKNMAHAFEIWIASSFSPGANILVVGHSPECEMIAFGLGLGQIRSLAECEGMRIVYWPEAARLEYEPVFTLVHGIPDLDPSGIRTEIENA